MNAGASTAKGRILLFLHADVRLPAGALEQVTVTSLRGEPVRLAYGDLCEELQPAAGESCTLNASLKRS